MMNMNKKRLVFEALCLTLASLFALFATACDSYSCRKAIGLSELPTEGFFRRCIFGKDLLTASFSHEIPLYSACNFYVNTEPLQFIKSSSEGIILDQRFNSRLNKNVFQVKVAETAWEGWVLASDLSLLTDIYKNKELNAQEAKLFCRLKVARLSPAVYQFDLLFVNEEAEIRELFFSPLLNTSTQSPPFEVRTQATGDLINFDLDLKALTTDDYLYLAGRYLYKKLKPQGKWPLTFYLHFKEDKDTSTSSGYFGLINYLCRPEGNPLQYWLCASALEQFD